MIELNTIIAESKLTISYHFPFAVKWINIAIK